MRVLLIDSNTSQFILVQCNHVPTVGSQVSKFSYSETVTNVLNWPDPTLVIEITGKLQGDVDALVFVK